MIIYSSFAILAFDSKNWKNYRNKCYEREERLKSNMFNK